MIDREAWHVVVHDVAESRTQLSDWTELMLTFKIYNADKTGVILKLYFLIVQ